MEGICLLLFIVSRHEMCGDVRCMFPYPSPTRSQTCAYITRVAANAPCVTSVLHELCDLAKVTRKSSAKTYKCQHNFNIQYSEAIESFTYVRIGSNKMTAVNVAGGGGKKWHVLLTKLKILSSGTF
jgi:hypothetical protein